MFFDQRFGSRNHISGNRDPIEVGDEELTARMQYAGDFPGGCRSVEPVPALPGSDHIRAVGRQAGVFGGGDLIIDIYTGILIKLHGLRQHIFGWIDANHPAAAGCEAARQ